MKAVLSIDDDLVIPCRTLSHAVSVWQSNKRVLVGFSPRMIVYDIVTGETICFQTLSGWLSGSIRMKLIRLLDSIT